MSTGPKFDLLTLFPGIVSGILAESMLGRAIASGLIRIGVHDIREWGCGKHRITDDRPFGGGAGMVMKPEPLFAAIAELKEEMSEVIFMAPDGEQLTSSLARELSERPHLILVSGHYEGIDERVRQTVIDREISIGDYILTNGTLAAAVLIDSVCRYVPGFLGEEKSLTQDSFVHNLLSFPQYTRPAEFRGMCVPEVLLSGNHEEIERWRRSQRGERTRTKRPDLIQEKDPNHEPDHQ